MVAAIIARLVVLTNYQINWDEFFFLSKVHQFLHNDLAKVMQSFHVHFFTWLPFISENEADQIIVARGVMACLQFATAVCLFRISKRFLSNPAAWFVVLSYFSFSNVIRHGASFRADPIATFLLIASIDLTLNSTMVASSILAGILIGLAGIITIKSALYVPTIGSLLLVLIIFSDNRRVVFTKSLVMISSALAAFVLFYLYHKSSLAVEPIQQAVASIDHGYNKTINFTQIFPKVGYFRSSLKSDFVYWIAIGFGLFITAKSIKDTTFMDRATALIIIAMVFPLITILFYRNAYPYYYTFIMASTSILCGVAWDAMPWQKQPNIAKLFVVFSLFSIVVRIITYGYILPYTKNLNHQKNILSVIHKVFPEPVPYIDRCSMVSSYPKVGMFMSTWGLENYREANMPILSQTITKEQPKFLVVNINQLDPLLTSEQRQNTIHPDYDLLQEDIAVLRDNYIQHWGKLFVPGKKLQLNKDEISYFNILIEGIYTVESSIAVIINNNEVMPGETIFLNRGVNVLTTSYAGNLYLRWGDHLYMPNMPAYKYSLFNGF